MAVPLVMVGYQKVQFSKIRANRAQTWIKYQSLPNAVESKVKSEKTGVNQVEKISWAYPGPRKVYCIPYGSWGNNYWHPITYPVKHLHDET